ncbi:hypothetical protein [Pseudomonas sivasensis]|uniref:hypothetical protein n=1 Tax=Pseudomonas sivasensis TaxID=1880678 RepID=UPI0030D8BC4E
MQEANNPVGKLLGYMNKAVEIPGDVITADAWASILGCKLDDSRSLVRGLGMMMDLSVTARKAIEEYVPGDKTLFLPPFARIDRILSNHAPNQQWKSHKAQLDADTMSALRFGNYALGLSYPAANAEKSAEISDFIERLGSLLEECLKSDLSPEIKKLFVRHLEGIRTALLDYKLGGTSDLGEVVDTAIGSMHRHASAIEGESKGGLAIARKVFDAIANANEVITFSQSLILLSAPVALNLLPLIK